MNFLTKDQIYNLINEEVELSELRGSYLSYLVQRAEELTGQDWPEYVIRDWLYATTKERKDFNVDRYIHLFIKFFGKGHWKFEKNKINVNSFNNNTIKNFKIRDFGKQYFSSIRNDFERFMTQQDLLSKRGKVSEEPIICVKRTDGLELLEGWHRTMMNLNRFKEYEQNMYVYYPDEI